MTFAVAEVKATDSGKVIMDVETEGKVMSGIWSIMALCDLLMLAEANSTVGSMGEKTLYSSAQMILDQTANITAALGLTA